MTIHVPSRSFRLGEAISCTPRSVGIDVVQDHVIRHVFGTGELLRRTVKGKRQWNAEGWDQTDPPVLTAAQRSELAQSITTLDSAGKRCTVPRLRRTEYGGGPPDDDIRYCMRCPSELLSDCVRLCQSVHERYLAVVDRVLENLEAGGALRVPRVELCQRVMSAVRRNPRSLDALVVLTLGWAGENESRLIARLTSGAGFRVEFYAEARADGGFDLARWRTTYRHEARPAGTASFILDTPARRPDEEGLLSSECVVPQSWWHAEDAS